MSRRRLVPVDPEKQPPIRTFISECRKAGLTGTTGKHIVNKVINKKRRRSNEDKKTSVKKKPHSTQKVKESPEELALTHKMASIVVTPDSKDPMVIAMEGIESRLLSSMKENREKEIAEMEVRLKNNMKEIIETSIQRAINEMGNTTHQMITSNPVVQNNKTEVENLKEENSRLIKELQHITAEQGKLESRMERIENRNLENCLIFRGIKEELKETDKSSREKIYRELSNLITEDNPEDRYLMAKRLVIRRLKRIGRYNREKSRPISVEFVHHENVAYIMENKSYLSEGVFVNKEYSPEIERKCRVLLPILRAAKSIEGYKKQIRLENNKIVIKGKDYDIKNIHELPEDLNAFKVTSKENDTTVGFFGELNPLSNFFPASFQTKRQHYISSEQFIQASKAQYFGDIDVYNQIMGCKNSSDCKEFSRKISGVDHSKWETVAADICHIGIRDKFIQNPILMEILVRRTGTKRIVECANDRLWGTGIPLAHPDSLDSDRWITPGIMGKILEEIRLEFCSHYPPPP